MGWLTLAARIAIPTAARLLKRPLSFKSKAWLEVLYLGYNTKRRSKQTVDTNSLELMVEMAMGNTGIAGVIAGVAAAKLDVKMYEAQNLFIGIPRQAITDALFESGQIVINSTQLGYMKKKSPEGKAWAPNPEWYIAMKGGSAPLIGPSSKRIMGGRYSKNYEFADVSSKSMRNSLEVTRKGFYSVEIGYDTKSRKRAYRMQKGGSSKMILKSTHGGHNVEIDLKVKARPHLGVADKFTRLGSKTDPDHVEKVFGDMFERAIMQR